MPGTSVAESYLQDAGRCVGTKQGSSALYSHLCVGCQIRHLGFCGGLKGPELLALSVRASSRTIPAGDTVMVNSDAKQIAIVVAGFLRFFRQRADGHRQVIDLICPGELIEFSQLTGYVEIEAATEARICRIHPASNADLLSSSHGFRRAVLSSRQRMVDRMRAHAWALSALRPAEHIALFLLNSCANMPWQPLPSGGGILTMQLSRSDIAAYLGTTVETVCRVVRKLDDAGLIRAHDNRRFEIPDLSSLGRFARTGCLTGVALAEVHSG